MFTVCPVAFEPNRENLTHYQIPSIIPDVPSSSSVVDFVVVCVFNVNKGEIDSIIF